MKKVILLACVTLAALFIGHTGKASASCAGYTATAINWGGPVSMMWGGVVSCTGNDHIRMWVTLQQHSGCNWTCFETVRVIGPWDCYSSICNFFNYDQICLHNVAYRDVVTWNNYTTGNMNNNSPWSPTTVAC